MLMVRDKERRRGREIQTYVYRKREISREGDGKKSSNKKTEIER